MRNEVVTPNTGMVAGGLADDLLNACDEALRAHGLHPKSLDDIVTSCLVELSDRGSTHGSIFTGG